MAARILRVSATFRRSVEKLGVVALSPVYRAVSTTMRALASADLPGAGDFEIAFSPGRAFVRRVVEQNLWIVYRFDENHVFVMTARGQPPVPADE